MYERGQLQIVTPECEMCDEDGLCSYDGDPDHKHSVNDSTTRDDDPRRTRKSPAVFLPHSCGEWVIGGPDEIKMMIEDLQAALVAVKAVW